MSYSDANIGSASGTALRRYCRVLVADDDPPCLELASESLRLYGCEVTAVRSGTEAIDAYERSSFDLLLLDVCMPGMTGLEVISHIRRQEELGRPRIRAVALTGNAWEDDEKACLAAGMDAVLVKPFRLDQLKTLLEKFCASDAASAVRSQEPERPPGAMR